MKPTNVTGYPFSNGDRLTAVSVNQICNALDAIQDYNDTIKEFEDLVEENTEEIKSEINRVAYDDVSVNGIAGEVGAGKAAIAAAINAKGGTAQADGSFTQLAEDIENIPVNVQVEDAANLAFPESIAWNILKEAYAQQRVGYASWIVAEFFKEYDTIPLSGADAFYTCDGDFYTSATTHTWHDESYNKVNRFVVYYFTGENVPFSVTQESVCPRSMAVMGKFGSINIASAGRIRQIYNGGEINDISFASTNPWCDEVLLGGVKEHNSGYILNGNSVVQMFASDIEVLNGGRVITGNNTSLTTAIFPRLKNTSGGTLMYNANNSTNLSDIIAPSIENIAGTTLLDFRGTNGTTCAIRNINLQNLKHIKNSAIVIAVKTSSTYMPSLRVLELPSLEDINGFIIQGDGYYGLIYELRVLRMPKLTNCTNTITSSNDSLFGSSNGTSLMNMIELEIGQNYNGNLNLKNWGATNAIKDTDNSLVDEGETFANNREKFLYNFEKYIVDKLADNSTTGLSFTLTLRSAVYNVVFATQSITDKLTAKHWNLASV